MKRLMMVVAVVCLGAVMTAHAVTIDVPNGDFESPVVAGTTYYDIAGWTGAPDTWWGLDSGGPTGQYAVVTQQPGGIWFDAVDGTTTSILAEAHQDITLNFDAACTWGTGYPLGLEVFTDSGTIATLSVYPGAAHTNWASYSETLSWTGNAVGIGEQLKVLFTTHTGGYVYFDNVSGDIVSIPEPATMLLLGMGGLLLRKRR